MERVVIDKSNKREPPPPLTGYKRLLSAAKCSWIGIRAAYASEEAIRQEMFLLLIGTPLGLWLGQTTIEKIILVGSLFMILIVELLNTAVETTIDRISYEIHELSGKAKDIGSAAVMVSIILTLFVWGIILYERFWG